MNSICITGAAQSDLQRVAHLLQRNRLDPPAFFQDFDPMYYL